MYRIAIWWTEMKLSEQNSVTKNKMKKYSENENKLSKLSSFSIPFKKWITHNYAQFREFLDLYSIN